MDRLEHEGPFTLLVPTDAAFAKLPRIILDSYLSDQDALEELVSNHIIEGEVSSKDIKFMNIRALLCGKLFRMHRNSVYVEQARIVLPDMACINGMVHGINRVLLPKRKHHKKYQWRGRIGGI